MVPVGCRHPRAVPLAFRVSAQFDGLAHMSPLVPIKIRVRISSVVISCPGHLHMQKTFKLLRACAKRHSAIDSASIHVRRSNEMLLGAIE